MKKVYRSLLSILLVLTMLVPNMLLPVIASEDLIEGYSDVNTDNIVLNKQTVPTNDPEIFRIDLETYAKGALVTNIESADIVLILDTSGSMSNDYADYARVESSSYLSTSKYYYIYKGGKYVKIDYYTATSKREAGWYVIESPVSNIVTSKKLKFNPKGTGANNEYAFYSTTKIDALKHSVTVFIDKVYEYTQTYNVDFRIAVVKFSDSSSVITGNKKSNSGAYVSVKNNASAIKSAIWNLNASGSTYPGSGTDKALKIIKSGYQEEKHLFTVLFSDGAASSTSTTTGSYGAVTDAYEIKNTYGGKVYSVGIFDELPTSTSSVYYMLNAVSSNYPNAKKPLKNSLGTKASSEYYIPATDFDGLDSAFDKITSAVGKPYEDLVVKDFVTQYFYLTEEQKAAIKKAYPDTVELVEHDDGTTEIKIINLDFPIVICDDDGNPLDPNDPGIFRFSFYITIKEEFAGGNQVPTNTPDSGVYDSSDNELVEYPVPDVDIPIKYDINAHDHSIYIGDTVEQSDIFTNMDGKWMSDLVHIEYIVTDSKGNNFTSDDSLNHNETYTVTAIVTPLHEGDFEAVTFTDTATVNVFKPEITFTDNFNIYKGDKADISENYTVEWLCPENLQADLPDGNAPEVFVELADKDGAITDHEEYGPIPAEAEKVNYGINATDVYSNGSLISPADYTVFPADGTIVKDSDFTVTVVPNLIKYHLDGGKMESNPEQYTHGIGVAKFNPATKQGYDFVKWVNTKTGEEITSISNTAKGDYELTAIYAARTDTKYRVNHYTENLDGSWNLEFFDILKGETDQRVKADEKSFGGFTFSDALSKTTGVVTADGSLVLNLYYVRNEYNLNITYVMSDGTTPPDEYSVELLYAEEYAVDSPVVPGYTPDRIIVEGTMPMDDVKEVVVYTPNADTKYEVQHYTENLDGSWKLEATEEFSGVTNTTATAEPNEYVGFTFDRNLGKLSGKIAGDGSLVLKVYYRRNSNKLTVEYVMADGTKAPDKYVDTLKYGEDYSVKTP
ncbi:MAG: InlB B-repeat-containing protein, partial [Clostridia bacterium]|nr:InlB B-repeat-containing protein [Clostridia bacterium]